MKFVKFIRLILAISIVSSATSVTAQDKPADPPEVVVEGSQDAVGELKQQLKSVRAELEKVTTLAALRAQQLEANAQQLEAKQRAMMEQERQIAAVKQEARLAEEQIKNAQKAAAESMMQAEKARVDAEKARLTQELGIAQYKAMLQYVEKKQGPNHAYSQQLKAQLMELEQSLAEMSLQFGPQHPNVVQRRKKVEAVHQQLRKVDPASTAPAEHEQQIKARSSANVQTLEKALAEAKMIEQTRNPEALEKLRSQIADETVAPENIVSQNQRNAAVTDKLLADDKGLSQTFGTRLDSIRNAESPLGAVSKKFAELI